MTLILLFVSFSGRQACLKLILPFLLETTGSLLQKSSPLIFSTGELMWSGNSGEGKIKKQEVEQYQKMLKIIISSFFHRRQQHFHRCHHLLFSLFLSFSPSIPHRIHYVMGDSDKKGKWEKENSGNPLFLGCFNFKIGLTTGLFRLQLLVELNWRDRQQSSLFFHFFPVSHFWDFDQ